MLPRLGESPERERENTQGGGVRNTGAEATAAGGKGERGEGEVASESGRRLHGPRFFFSPRAEQNAPPSSRLRAALRRPRPPHTASLTHGRRARAPTARRTQRLSVYADGTRSLHAAPPAGAASAMPRRGAHGRKRLCHVRAHRGARSRDGRVHEGPGPREAERDVPPWRPALQGDAREHGLRLRDRADRHAVLREERRRAGRLGRDRLGNGRHADRREATRACCRPPAGRCSTCSTPRATGARLPHAASTARCSAAARSRGRLVAAHGGRAQDRLHSAAQRTPHGQEAFGPRVRLLLPPSIG